jgi:hypothetical protein
MWKSQWVCQLLVYSDKVIQRCKVWLGQLTDGIRPEDSGVKYLKTNSCFTNWDFCARVYIEQIKW